MLRLAADENFNHTITRGLLRRLPDLDLVRIHGQMTDADPFGQRRRCAVFALGQGLRHAGDGERPCAQFGVGHRRQESAVHPGGKSHQDPIHFHQRLTQPLKFCRIRHS